MNRPASPAVFGLVFLIGLWALGCQPDATPPPAEPLTLYAGRGKALVDSLVERFTAETGTPVNVRYGNTAELAVTLLEEGAQSPADVYWAQDAGALGAVSEADLFAALPADVTAQVPQGFQGRAGTWVATSGRARTLAYAPARVAAGTLPTSIFGLTEAKWKGRIGWAPTNGSFQSFVTALRNLVGEDRTRAWLVGMRDNGAKSFPSNSAIVQAIADGEVDLGLPNHYYLLRFKSRDAAFPVEQTFFAPQDPGNLVNIAGVGILKTSTHPDALAFVNYLLSAQAQAYFTNVVFEYPVVAATELGAGLVPLDSLMQARPVLDLDNLNDLESTLNLLREVELL